MISEGFSCRKKGFKYFIRYNSEKLITPLFTKLGYVRNFHTAKTISDQWIVIEKIQWNIGYGKQYNQRTIWQ